MRSHSHSAQSPEEPKTEPLSCPLFLFFMSLSFSFIYGEVKFSYFSENWCSWPCCGPLPPFCTLARRALGAQQGDRPLAEDEKGSFPTGHPLGRVRELIGKV